jgi:hypothetical protein
VLSITPFTATAFCGSATWKYSAVNQANLNPLVYATDKLGCDSITGSVKLNTNIAPGVY